MKTSDNESDKKRNVFSNFFPYNFSRIKKKQTKPVYHH